MNRAQRRKAKPVNPPTGRASKFAVMNTLFRNSRKETDISDLAELMNPVYLQITALMTGDMIVQGFISLSEAMMFGSFLAEKMNAEALGPNFTEAALALECIALRMGDTGKFVGKADEIESLRAAARSLDTMCANATQGLILQALQSADKRFADDGLSHYLVNAARHSDR